MEGLVFDLQGYSLHDGPGIRTSVYFKGCPLRCEWCHNPESQRRGPELSFRIERCSGCGSCVRTCPRGVPIVAGGVSHRDRERCTGCGACVSVCPEGALEKIGEPTDAAGLLQKLLGDAAFYEESGGGVTLTGGEPTLQPELLFALARRLGAAGIHTALETCGHFPSALVPRLAAAVDLFLFDVKHVSEERHRVGTGAGNRLILENFAALLALVGPARLVPRIPVITGFNADREALEALAAFLAGTGYRGEVHLLPQHDWAAGKYRRLGRARSGVAARTLSGHEREERAALFLAAGLTPVWGGES